VFFLKSKKSKTSECQGYKINSKRTLSFPPPWSTYRAVSLKTFSIGTIPLDDPFVPLIYDYFALILLQEIPIPPADFEILAD
jgi:hypothetical protein